MANYGPVLGSAWFMPDLLLPLPEFLQDWWLGLMDKNGWQPVDVAGEPTTVDGLTRVHFHDDSSIAHYHQHGHATHKPHDRSLPSYFNPADPAGAARAVTVSTGQKPPEIIGKPELV